MKLSIVIFLTVIAGCFSKSFDPSSRIVGGSFAAKNQFPHQVAIIYRGGLRCGGSIVAAQYVVTAAHCVVYDGKETLASKYFLKIHRK
jgi:secreted trypsin-like serine protease